MRKRKVKIDYLPEFGCIAIGVLYAGIGVIALLSFFKLRDGGADESSMLVVLNDFWIGKVIIFLILSGTACYVAWRIYEVFADPYRYGRSIKGLARRSGIALSTIADLLVTVACVRVLIGNNEIQGNGQPVEERAMTQALLNAGDDWLVVALGAGILATAIVQLLYGFTKGYKERVDEHDFSDNARKLFHALALFGYSARGLILGIVGFFFLKAGVSHEAGVVVNTDKAFDFIGDHIGHALFIITALGTIAYGCFMGALGLTYKPRAS